jgi:transcriptional regulator with XRE-family HTH domain
MSPVNVDNIGAFIRQQREQAKISLRKLAQAAGVSSPSLSQIERGLRRPSADILQQIARGLRISAEALYIQAGILEDRPPGSGVPEAVMADPGLTERQKQMLIEIYESFRSETAAQQPAAVGNGTRPPDPESARAGPGGEAVFWPEDVAAIAAQAAPGAEEPSGGEA